MAIRGQVGLWCADWVDLCPSWVEVSPSGTGLRAVLARCGAPAVMHEKRGVGYYGNQKAR